LQIGRDKAAQRDPRFAGSRNSREGDRGWYWSGETLSGRRRTIRTLEYLDHDWRIANRLLVAEELKQCIGRARAVLDAGIPCIVFSADEIAGAKLVDESDDLPLIRSEHHGLLMEITTRGSPGEAVNRAAKLNDLIRVGAIEKGSLRSRWRVVKDNEKKTRSLLQLR